jgi:AP-3 complex subunit sigma
VDEQQRIIREVFALVSKRTERACNFLENKGIVPGPDAQGVFYCGKKKKKKKKNKSANTIKNKKHSGCKLIYRHYATLYFIFVADATESELGILDLIQVFVEALDKCFENVCELDLIFHPDRVCYILDEIVQGGMVLETRQDEILTALAAMAKIEKEQDPLAKIKGVFNAVRRNN